jgi:hypothetical protein
MRKGDGSWILTRWNMKRGSEGYRGVFTGMPGAKGAQDELTSGKAAPRFNFLVRNLQA